jgi:hypothetical protein
VEEAGGSYVIRGGKTIALQELPPQSRIVVIKFESMGKMPDGGIRPLERPIGEKYASFRVYAVEGTSQ